MRSVIGALILAVVAVQAQGAERRYVGDTLVITLRAGMGDEYRIIKTLPSGTAMELLEERPPWGHVRLEDGREGWVRLQYLIDTPIARDQLQQVRLRLDSAEKESRRLADELASLTQRADALERQRRQLEKENLRLTQENEKLNSLAARPLELDRQNKRLRAENQRLSSEMKQVRAENLELRNSTVQKWFVAGGGVLIGGILLGFWLPRFGRRQRSSW